MSEISTPCSRICKYPASGIPSYIFLDLLIFVILFQDSNVTLADIPKNIVKYVQTFFDPIGDGHCGFQAIAHQVYGDEGQYGQLRQNMLKEIQKNKQFYLHLAPVTMTETLENITQGINDLLPEVTSPYYLDVWKMGDIVCNTIRRPLFYYSRYYSLSLFPNLYPPTPSHSQLQLRSV